ncbi:MAG: MucBP domain-containing protein, partial [Lactobacillus sp.]|nr:MucBP domain-containing protein [Lactobacillus sp.]
MVDQPVGHTGEELNLTKEGSYIVNILQNKAELKGYHYASNDELNGNLQPGNLNYTTDNQDVTVYVAGDEVDPNDLSKGAVVVHHYLKDAEGNETTTKVPGMDDIHKGGLVGDKLEFKLTDQEQQAPDGYELSSGQSDQEWTLKADEGKEIIFYYEAKSQDNITVNFVNANHLDKVVGTVKPTGHRTGEELDLKSKEVTDKVPEGYHIAKDDELNGLKDSDGNQLTQPKNPKYTTTAQSTKVWVIGDKVEANATDDSAITIKHELDDGKPVPGMQDSYLGGLIGDTVKVDPNLPEHKAPAGYELKPNQKFKDIVLEPKGKKTIKIIYTAKGQNNITVEFEDLNTQKKIEPSYKPSGHKTGEELDLSEKNEELKSRIPKGYHYATEAELTAKGVKQPENPKYSDDEQTVKVYVVGNKIEASDKNALTVHYYLRDKDGKNTTTKVKEDRKVGGIVGQEITIGKNDPEQAAPAGYSQASDQEDQKYTFDPENGGEVKFYYTANEVSNITVNFFDANHPERKVGETKPTGHHTGDELNLLGKEVTDKVPEGYHIAKDEELKNLKDSDGNVLSQPTNPKYGTEEQNPKVWVIGNKVEANANDKSAITLHHVLDDVNKTPVPGMKDSYLGGLIGDTVKVDLELAEHKAPAGYTLKSNQEFNNLVLKPNGGKVVNILYTADDQDNITLDFIDANTGKSISKKKPGGTHYTGEELDLSSRDVISKVPAGYHIAKEDELNGNTQPKNPVYTTKEQTTKIFVVGNEVDDNASNAVTVRHYLKGTNTPVPGMDDIHKGGRVGQTLKFKLTDPEQKAPKGYQLSADQTDQEWTLKADEGKEIIFYYEAKSADNITINFVDVKTGKSLAKEKPAGTHKVGDPLEISSNDVKTKVPSGYRIAENTELNGKEQPSNVKYKTDPQEVKVWVVGKNVTGDDKNALTVHYYLRDKDGKNTTTKVKVDRKVGGIVG